MMSGNKKFLYATIVAIISVALAVAAVEIFFKTFPQLLPTQFTHVQQTTYDPVVGSKLRPNYEINLEIGDGTSYNVKTVDLGFENIGFRDDGIDGDVYGVTLGDSFTFGEGVNMSDTWTEILERETGRDFVNMGVSGHGTEHELRFLREYGSKLEPEVIIVMFHENDFGNNHGLITTQAQGVRNFLRENFVTYEVLKFVLGNKDLPTNQDAIVYKDENFEFDFFPRWWWKKSDSESEITKFGEDVTEKDFSEMKRIADSVGAEILVVTVPPKENIYSHLIADRVDITEYDLGYPTRRALEICNIVEIDCLDLTPVLIEKGSDEQLYFRVDGHLNERGNEVAAEAILEFLESKNLTG